MQTKIGLAAVATQTDVRTQLLEQIECRVAIKPNEGDYLQDGLWYCGRCHTAKQVLVEIPWQHKQRIFACVCRCEGEQAEREQAAFAKEQQFRRVQRLLPQGVPSAMLQRCRFDTADGSNGKAMAALKRYVNKFPNMLEENIGLLLYGAPGTGKTFAAACVAQGLLEQRHTVLMTNFSALVRDLSNYKTDINQYLRQLNCYDLLILDDLGVERPTAAVLEKLYLVIDERYKAGRPVVITTNMNQVEMKQNDNGWLRVYDRINAMCVPLPFNGASKRNDTHSRKLAVSRSELLD